MKTESQRLTKEQSKIKGRYLLVLLMTIVTLLITGLPLLFKKDTVNYDPDSPPLNADKAATLNVRLMSEIGIDYTQLKNQLASGNWEEANRETGNLMDRIKQASSRHKDRLPCQDLQTIDRLWVAASNGQFGFSVQKIIWQGVGGSRNPSKKSGDDFSTRVGWNSKMRVGAGLPWDYALNAPKGHLPRHIDGMLDESYEPKKWGILFSRVQSCGR